MCCKNHLEWSVLLLTLAKPIFVLPGRKVKLTTVGWAVLERRFGEFSRFNLASFLGLSKNSVVKQPFLFSVYGCVVDGLGSGLFFFSYEV
jgi:CTP-dependent riboflavin kinase